jgi:hypothetical protein
MVTMDAASTLKATGKYCHAISLGGSYESETTVTGATVTVAGTIDGNILATKYAANNTITLPDEYATTITDEGYAYTEANGMITITGLLVPENVTVEGDETIALSDEAKAILSEIAKTEGMITSVVVAEGTANSEGVNGALELFENIVTVEDKKATIAWNFGITDMTIVKGQDGTLQVALTAAVTNGNDDTAKFANGVTVEFYNGDTLVRSVEVATVTDKTEVTATLPLTSETGRTLFSVKAKNTATTN